MANIILKDLPLLNRAPTAEEKIPISIAGSGGSYNVSYEKLVYGISEASEIADKIVEKASPIVATETAGRQSADTTLQNNITAETTARQSADTTLQNNINAEAIARQNADTTETTRAKKAEGDLQTALTAETERAEQAETDLQTALTAETERAEQAEADLQAGKPNRSELTKVVTTAGLSADETSLTVTLSLYNSQTQANATQTLSFPIASGALTGAMNAETFNALQTALSDIVSLKAAGGKWIGRNFDTKADLDAYAIPVAVNVNDWADVIADETYDGHHTRYSVINNEGVKLFAFQYLVQETPIPIATAETLGLTKSTEAENGKIFVELDGTMSLLGWDFITSTFAELERILDTKQDKSYEDLPEAATDRWTLNGRTHNNKNRYWRRFTGNLTGNANAKVTLTLGTGVDWIGFTDGILQYGANNTWQTVKQEDDVGNKSWFYINANSELIFATVSNNNRTGTNNNGYDITVEVTTTNGNAPQ